MQNSADFQAVYQTEAFEKADSEQINRWENPELDFSAILTSIPGEKDETSFELEIEQPLRFSQLNGKRSAYAKALFERAEIRQQHGIIQAYWAIKTLYAQTWLIQQRAELYQEFSANAKKTAHIMDRAVNAGQTAISEGSLFAGDMAKFESDLEAIQAEQYQLQYALEKATGLNLSGKVLEQPSLPVLDGSPQEWETQALANPSLVRLLSADLSAAKKQQSLAITDGTAPQIAPRFIYGRNQNDREESIGLGIAVTIPLWDSNQNERQKAQANHIYAQRQLDTLQSLPLSERLNRIHESMIRLDKRLEKLKNQAIPNYRRSFEQAQKSFNAGQTDAMTLWQIRERLFSTEQDVLQAVLDALEARRILSLETGTIPQEVTL